LSEALNLPDLHNGRMLGLSAFMVAMHSLYAQTPTQTRSAAAVQYNTLC